MFVTPDGNPLLDHNRRPTEPTLPMRRRRGRRLSDEQVRELNDLVHFLLTDAFGLSLADARRVVERRVSEARLLARLSQVRAEARDYGTFTLMAEVIRDAG